MSTRGRRNHRRGGRKSRQQRVKERNRAVLLLVLAGIAVIVLVIAGYRLLFAPFQENAKSSTALQTSEEDWEGAPPLDVQLLTVNEYSRPGIALEKINGIVIHYTANPGSSAQANRDYFEGLKDEHTTKASSHFVIGLEGEIVQCIPSTEISYASNDRNDDTLSIECCHPDESGEFTDATYQSLVELTSWLCERFQIPVDNVIRHYDVTGKDCPKYFVDHEDAWEQFKEEVSQAVSAGEEGEK
ncbi:MAG: N-acetylmuramoyl-L-alanine amidase family protein [Ruminococcus sp.]|jgi:N-acetylmuramoyl-L-alanine amidase